MRTAVQRVPAFVGLHAVSPTVDVERRTADASGHAPYLLVNLKRIVRIGSRIVERHHGVFAHAVCQNGKFLHNPAQVQHEDARTTPVGQHIAGYGLPVDQAEIAGSGGIAHRSNPAVGLFNQTD